MKIKTIEFFTLDETPLKLRKADWIEYICFEPKISEANKIQNCVLSSADNPIDTLLKGAFEFIDVNDSTTVNKILEDATHAHL